MWNQAFFRTIRIQYGRIEDFTHEEPSASLLGSHKDSMVDLRGLYSNLGRLADTLRGLTHDHRADHGPD